MLIQEQLEFLESLGLCFHHSLTPELFEQNVRHLNWWDYLDPPFHNLFYAIRWMQGELCEQYRLSPRTFTLDFESYDRPTKYSELAEEISETAGSRQHLYLVDENMRVERNKQGSRTGVGWIEYRFQKETFKHDHPYYGDWVFRKTFWEMALRFSSIDDGFQFYGTTDSQGVELHYMLISKKKTVGDTLGMKPLSELM